jgi:hypothetical protein
MSRPTSHETLTGSSREEIADRCGDRGGRPGGGELSARQARYTAGGEVTGGAGTVSDRIVLAIGVLESAGWKVTSEGTTSQGDAYGRLSRDGVKLSIDRDPLEGSEEFGVDVAGPCFKVTDEQYSDLPHDEQIVP